jgi:hypothetical protein
MLNFKVDWKLTMGEKVDVGSVLLHTGIETAKGAVDEFSAQSKLSVEASNGDLLGMLKGELAVQEAEAQLAEAIPELGAIIATAMRHFGDRDGVEQALNNVEDITKATAEMEKESVRLHREAIVEKAQAEGKSAAEITAIKARWSQEDYAKQLDADQEKVNQALLLWEKSLGHMDEESHKHRLLPQDWDVEGWKKIQSEYEQYGGLYKFPSRPIWAEKPEHLLRTAEKYEEQYEEVKKAYDALVAAEQEKRGADLEKSAPPATPSAASAPNIVSPPVRPQPSTEMGPPVAGNVWANITVNPPANMDVRELARKIVDLLPELIRRGHGQ